MNPDCCDSIDLISDLDLGFVFWSDLVCFCFIYNLFVFLFPGSEFFVGISNFTNEGGAKAVAAAFPEYPCVPIKVRIGENIY